MVVDLHRPYETLRCNVDLRKKPVERSSKLPCEDRWLIGWRLDRTVSLSRVESRECAVVLDPAGCGTAALMHVDANAGMN